MNNYAQKAKTTLIRIIEEMSASTEKYSSENCFRRKRKFDFSTLMRFILSFGSNSLGHEIGEFFEYKEGFPSVSAFVQQRKKLNWSAVQELFDKFNACSTKKAQLAHNYRLLAIDGCSQTLPYNPKEDNIIADNHFSSLHLNSLFDVCSRKFVDIVVQSAKDKNECSAACELVDRISEKYPVIVIADRGYESYNLFAHIEQRLFDYVIRIKDIASSGIASGLKLPQTETFDVTQSIVITRHSTGPASIMPEKYKYLSKTCRFDYIKDSKSPDYELSVRFVRFEISEGHYEVLATSLTEENFCADELKDIYRQRWGIETGFRELKYIFGLAAFHSKQENSILQEIFARLIMYNFSMCIIEKIKPKEKDRRYQLQVNFTQAARICLHFFRHRANEPPFDIKTTIQRFVLPVRPHRHQKRLAVRACIVSFNYRLA